MKKYFLVPCFHLIALFIQGQVIITSDSPQAILNSFFGGSPLGSFVSSQGANHQFGTFTADPFTIGIQNGIVLSTANIASPNAFTPPSFLTGANTPGYAPLNQEHNTSTNNAAVLTFSVMPQQDTLFFSFVYTSNDYPIYVCTQFIDPMAIYITGPDPSGGIYLDTNVARVPGTNLPININSINDVSCWNCPCNSQYLVNNMGPNPGMIVFQGYTVPILLSIPVVPGQNYVVTFAIADAVDGTNNAALFFDSDEFMQLNSIPVPPIITALGSIEFCDGDSVMLTSNFQSGNVWSTGDTTQYITVYSSGVYSFSVNVDGAVLTSDSLSVTVNPVPAPPTISSADGTYICPGQSIVLTSGNTQNNLWSTGEIGQSISVNEPGLYFVQAVLNGCLSLPSDSILISFYPYPSSSFSVSGVMPLFNFWADTTNTLSVLWDFGDGSPSDGNFTTTHSYSQNGSYLVELTKIGEYCTRYFYDVVHVWGLENSQYEENSDFLLLFPSPAQEYLNITIGADSESVIFKIFDVGGRLITSNIVGLKNSSTYFTIDISALPNGLYYLAACGEDGFFKSMPFVKVAY